MEDAFHCNPDGLVVGVNRFWVVRPAGWVERLSGGQEGFDSFVPEDEQRSHRSEPGVTGIGKDRGRHPGAGCGEGRQLAMDSNIQDKITNITTAPQKER